MKHSVVLMAISLAILTACAGEHKNTSWDDIDYSRIARENQRRENDTNYVPPVPTAIGCMDDDLYNCK